VEFFQQALGFRVGNYGMSRWSDLFTSRQLVALTTYTELVTETLQRIRRDAIAASGALDDKQGLEVGGKGPTAYAEAVSVFLAMALSRLADICNALCRWETSKTQVRNLFGRQAISMLWDFAENNVFADAAGDFGVSLGNLIKALQRMPAKGMGYAFQADAQSQSISCNKAISTDPPYYDNIGYADLSDFFYMWLRKALRSVMPALFSTLAVPKAEELVATPGRHGTKEQAEAFFLEGMTRAMQNLASKAHPAGPISL
jgi:putative DNA methylase